MMGANNSFAWLCNHFALFKASSKSLHSIKIKPTLEYVVTQTAVPFMQLRGGSSKGLYFLASDLPADEMVRNELLLAAVGRDNSQIDGLGGGQPLTSKVAIVSKSNRLDADVDFLFIQVVVGQNRVDSTPNCGNILAGIGPFSIESGLIDVTGSETLITVNMLNTDKRCELSIQTPDGQVSYQGNQRIDGVPGTSAPIVCNYLDVAGAVTGALFPTKNLTDIVEGIPVTCVDNGMPVVLVRSSDLGVSGYESPSELNTNQVLKDTLERIRLSVAEAMNIADARNKAVPKMCIVSEPNHGGLVNTRTFIPHHCHESIGVLGAVSVATACITHGTVADSLVDPNYDTHKPISVEHPSGELAVSLDYELRSSELHVRGAGVVRTARLLSKGVLYVSV